MVLPRLRGRVADARLTVAGEVGRLIDRRAGEDVRILGHVPSLLPLYEQARVFVAPLRYGAGLKGKILEALGRGIPLVTTSIGAEGIGLEHGVTAMIADDDNAFAEAVARLYNDRELWKRLRANALALVERDFSAIRFQARVGELLEQVCTPEARPAASAAQELAHSNR
jgi:glycosyltransferase involved in cell wall biosynthesis